MKKIGIIGGIGPESTVDYYKHIIAAFQKRGDGLTYPDIIIYSADLSALMAIIEGQDRAKMTDWLVERVQALHRGGAEFAVIASNSPHAVFDAVQARSPIPMISIVAATCDAAKKAGLQRPGLLGTRFTMSSDFYSRTFSEKGLNIIVPDQEDQALIQERLFKEIELGIIKETTRQELIDISQKMIAVEGIDGLILGCTELPMILDQRHFDIPVLDTTAIHVARIIEWCMERD